MAKPCAVFSSAGFAAGADAQKPILRQRMTHGASSFLPLLLLRARAKKGRRKWVRKYEQEIYSHTFLQQGKKKKKEK